MSSQRFSDVAHAVLYGIARRCDFPRDIRILLVQYIKEALRSRLYSEEEWDESVKKHRTTYYLAY